MPEIAHAYLESNTAETSTSGSWVDVPNAAISGASLTANTKYLIIARALFGNTDNTAICWLRVSSADDANLALRSYTRTELEQIGASALKSYFFAHTITTSAVPTDVKFEFATDAGTVTADQLSLLLIDLDDLGASNYVESFNDTVTDLNLTPWGATAVSIPGSSLGTTEEWLVFGYTRIWTGNSNRLISSRLFGADDSSAGSTLCSMTEGTENGVARRIIGYMGRHKAVTSDVSVSIDGHHTIDGAFQFEGGFLIALKASAFADFDFDYTPAAITATTETTVASIPVSPSVNGNHVILGLTRNDSVGADITLHLEDGTTEARTGDSTPTHDQNWSAGDDFELAYTMQRIDVQAPKTYNLRAVNQLSSGVSDRSLFALNLNTPAVGGPDQSIEIDMEARKIRRIAI